MTADSKLYTLKKLNSSFCWPVLTDLQRADILGMSRQHRLLEVEILLEMRALQKPRQVCLPMGHPK